MTRLEWQKLAERRLVDAKRLLDERRWSAAYYFVEQFAPDGKIGA